MRVVLVGASGAIGRELLPRLVARGHEVTGTATGKRGRRTIEALGATPLLLDATDRAAVDRAFAKTKPEVVVFEVTSLSGDISRFDELIERTLRVRETAAANAIDAAVAAGARRFVIQSSAYWYAEGEGLGPATEQEPRRDIPAATALWDAEEHVFGAPLEGIAARYGYFYGPGTWYALDGAIAELLRDRAYPITRRGESSFVQVGDAAEATALLVESAAPGAYNVVDDDPAPEDEWLAVLAEVAGAPPPEVGERKEPLDRGASNARAKAELGWQPRWPSWRMGFREAN